VTRLSVAASPEAAARRAAERIAEAVLAARAERGRAHVALAGGHTPRRAYELLAGMVQGWEGVELWFGDERCVPPDDPESNYRLVAESLLAGAAIDSGQVHRIAGERAPAEAAAAYAEELRRQVPADDRGVPVLDLALLGLGEDAHTASLFPGDPVVQRHDGLAFAVRAAKPPPDRITLALDVLRAARRVVFLAVGADKREAVGRVLAGPDPSAPASLVAGEHAELVIDEAARP
jgi:6-phosphogluconolactonase